MGAAPERSAEQEVLRIALEVAREVRAGMAAPAVGPAGLGSSLERDLGLDSLGRAELVARLERSFEVELPEQVLGTAETPADLARALAAARSRDGAALEMPHDRPPAAGPLGSAEDSPAEAAPQRTRTLVEVLEWHAERHPRRRHVLFYPGDGPPLELTYGELLARARRLAGGLRAARGGIELERGQAVALMLPSGHDYFAAFCGVLLAGGVPVPLYPPARRSQIEDHLRRQAGILATSQAVALITFPEVMTVARLLRAQVAGLGRVTTVAELEARGAARGGGASGGGRGGSGGGEEVGTGGEDVALLQFTSGSTGRPKGVVLTHANLLANLRAIGRAVAIGPQDVVVSWLPLYHDMGLIGAWMASLYYGMPLVLMSPLAFLAHPARWLQALSRHRGTLSAAPNFAYELCARKIADEDLAGVDLSAWRFALNGAEPVSHEAITRFAARFRRHGFRPEAMAPVYGLAEGSLALAFPPLERGPVIDVVEREAFERSGRAVPVGSGLEPLALDEAAGERASPIAGAGRPADERTTLSFVGCGVPLPGHDLRVVDAAGHEVGERQEGRLQFRGPSATSGYFRDAEATARLRAGGDWLESGDRAYTVGREVLIVPAALRGTRHVFRDDAAIFRRGTVELELLPAIRPDGDDWPAALRLRDRVRAAILERYGEPDLAAEGGSD